MMMLKVHAFLSGRFSVDSGLSRSTLRLWTAAMTSWQWAAALECSTFTVAALLI